MERGATERGSAAGAVIGATVNAAGTSIARAPLIVGAAPGIGGAVLAIDAAEAVSDDECCSTADAFASGSVEGTRLVDRRVSDTGVGEELTTGLRDVLLAIVALLRADLPAVDLVPGRDGFAWSDLDVPDYC